MEVNPYAAIQSLYPSFSKVFKRIADYILEDSNRVLDISIHQMAHELDIAESSIVRFCKIIGFSGFSEAKMMLAKYSSYYSSSIFESLSETDSAESVTRSVFAKNIDTLQKTVDLLDFKKIEAASELIRNARQIVICGIGSSASIADNFAVHLMRIGMPATSITDSELLQISARLSCPDTLFIAVSKTGSNQPIVNAFRITRETGAKTVCLTCYLDTPVEKYCDVCIVHYYPTEALVSTRVVQNTLIDALIINATMYRQQEVVDTLAANRRVVKSLRF